RYCCNRVSMRRDMNRCDATVNALHLGPSRRYAGRACRGAATMNASDWEETPIGACTQDPERWTTRADEVAKSICRECPRRWMCAREACELPRAEGLWAGIVIPEGGRGRTFALRQLRSLAERNGYPVRDRRLYAESA